MALGARGLQLLDPIGSGRHSGGIEEKDGVKQGEAEGKGVGISRLNPLRQQRDPSAGDDDPRSYEGASQTSEVERQGTVGDWAATWRLSGLR